MKSFNRYAYDIKLTIKQFTLILFSHGMSKGYTRIFQHYFVELCSDILAMGKKLYNYQMGNIFINWN